MNPQDPQKFPVEYADEVKHLDSGYVSNYVAGVFGWMFLALMITAGISLLVSSNEVLMLTIFGSRFGYLVLILLQLFLVGYLSFRIHKMSFTTALTIFLAYAALNGVTFSFLILLYDFKLILTSFGITAITFGIMSIVGYTTKKDLTSFGNLMFMGLIGIILASILNFFIQSPVLYYVISYIGVAVFIGLTAYDVQKIKSYAYLDSQEDRKRGAILGALALYLDFINLFLYILRIFGNRK